MGVSYRHLSGVVFLFFSIPALAQIEVGPGSINGTVVREKGRLPAGLRIRVQQMRGGMPIADTQLSYDGSFRFDVTSIPPGDYQLKVVTWRDEEIYSEYVSIRKNSEPLQIHLPPKEGSEPVSGTVSYEELQVPKKAVKEMIRAQSAKQAGDVAAAIGHARKAIKMHPRYEAAHLGLGARYMETGNHPGALEEFDAAVRINPESAFGHANRGVALHALGRYDEAAAAARRSLLIDPDSEKAHFVLGLALAAGQKPGDEAVASLRRAGAVIPRARVMAAGMLADRGSLAEAIAEIDKYLKSDDQEFRGMAQQWRRKWTAQ
jgi:tetratricopeptide (TPR) repeat protein